MGLGSEFPYLEQEFFDINQNCYLNGRILKNQEMYIAKLKSPKDLHK